VLCSNQLSYVAIIGKARRIAKKAPRIQPFWFPRGDNDQKMSSPLLSVHNLSNQGLGPVDLELNAGECVTISGPSGAGKSLLLRAIADLDPHVGKVYLDGQSSEAFLPAEWRRQVAYLHAESAWWQEKIGEHFAADLPEHLYQMQLSAESMDWNVTRCSTGERQRLALLRLLENHPRVLLLDEPTASLDPDATLAVEGVLQTLCKQASVAILWVSHDPRQVERVADRHFWIDRGHLYEKHSKGNA
jgi:putative ABC transport system ATP-binding protein